MVEKYKGCTGALKYKEYLMRDIAVKLLDIDSTKKSWSYKNQDLEYYENQEKKYGKFNYCHLIATMSSKIDTKIEKIMEAHYAKLINHLDFTEVKIHSKEEREYNKYMIDVIFRENGTEIVSENIISLNIKKDDLNEKVLSILLVGLANNTLRYLEAHGCRYIDRNKYIKAELVNYLQVGDIYDN